MMNEDEWALFRRMLARRENYERKQVEKYVRERSATRPPAARTPWATGYLIAFASMAFGALFLVALAGFLASSR
jgi:hypothetical protein